MVMWTMKKLVAKFGNARINMAMALDFSRNGEIACGLHLTKNQLPQDKPWGIERHSRPDPKSSQTNIPPQDWIPAFAGMTTTNQASGNGSAEFQLAGGGHGQG
jgi:hypothetical protein